MICKLFSFESIKYNSKIMKKMEKLRTNNMELCRLKRRWLPEFDLEIVCTSDVRGVQMN